ncbi:hypothetical protein LSAT2_025156 [Lamellibrachia satsuma]|nr:hypothetical protein LSAT2_025156 [Lamellibrachia satsuma]
MVCPKALCLSALKLRRNPVKVATFLLVAVVFFNEYIVYVLQSWTWPSLTPSSARSPEDEERILFVADPQIVGVHDTYVNPQLAIYDCDRYLAKTFQYAFNHVQPDVVIFLGDLMDEGSNANGAEYKLYVQRFHQIFSKSTSHVKHVYLPGDNDVGGEMWDERVSFKVNRFNEYFGKEELVNTKLIDFFAFNYNVGDAVDAKMAAHLKMLMAVSAAPFRIILNHMNLLSQTRPEFDRLITSTNASLITTAHTHKAIMYRCSDCRDPDYLDVIWEGDKFLMESNVIYTINLHESRLLHEIVVPTCSYRMGVSNMGYERRSHRRVGGQTSKAD